MQLENLNLQGTIKVNVQVGNVSEDQIFMFFIGVVSQKDMDNSPDWYKDSNLKVGDISVEIEHSDMDNFQVGGIPIKEWQDVRKFKEFHKSIGIDYDSIIEDKLKEDNLIPTRESIIELVGPELVYSLKGNNHWMK